ncbi:MAG: 30S ribosome-binding factor RbfA [Planctomycetes bacterium]|nr:30S ribosome-binding factor RbfA [Planctomycetota bacterium]
MATRRQERINGLIVQELSRAIPELKDPRIGFVTIVKANVSPDLHHATVYFSVFGKDCNEEATLDALNRSAGHLRSVLSHQLAIRYTPQLHFAVDHSLATSDYISQLIKEARQSDPDHGLGPAPDDEQDEYDEENEEAEE